MGHHVAPDAVISEGRPESISAVRPYGAAAPHLGMHLLVSRNQRHRCNSDNQQSRCHQKVESAARFVVRESAGASPFLSVAAN